MKSKLAKTSFKSYKIERVVTISKDISLLRQYWDLGHMFLVWQQILDSWQMGQHELGMQQRPSILKQRLGRLPNYTCVKIFYAGPSFFLVSLASKRSFFLAPKVGIPISFNSSSVRVAKVGRSISWRTKMSAYLCFHCDQNGASKRAVIGPDQTNKGAQPTLLCRNGFIFHPLGEPLVGEEHRQTVPNVLLAAVFPSLPSHQRDHADRLWDLLPASYHGVTQGVDGRAKPVAVGGNL